MSNNKMRNNIFNPIEAARRVNERILRKLCAVYFVNDAISKQDVALTDLKGERVTITKQLASATMHHRYKWVVYLCAGCVNTKGERELKVETVTCQQYYLQSELVEFLNERHQAFFKDLRSKNVRIEFGGWTAKASGRELEDSELFDIFENMGAWDCDESRKAG